MFLGATHVRGNYSIVSDLVFIESFEKDYKYFFIKFSGLQQEVFPIFKVLNSTVINTFKVIIFYPPCSSSQDTETDAAYDKYKSYD